MKKLSEIKGEHALDVLADVLEPIIDIAQDKEFVEAIRKKDKKNAIKLLLKGHKKEILYVMAVLEEQEPETYEPPLLRLPAMLLEMFNDPELVSLFQSPDQLTSSGSVTANIEAIEQE